MALLLGACGKENQYVAPPPPKVIVQFPLQQTVTPYLEATGNVASENNIKLVARVEGYIQEIKYKDGDFVKKGAPLFIIEPEPYKVQLEQAQAAEEGAKATLVNAEAEFTRQVQLQAKDVSTQANLDRARANRDTARASVLQAQANVQTAEINLGYTTVSAPFDGVVTARKVSVGELVGGGHTTELATIVQMNPIWVWFNLSERDVQRVRVQVAKRGETVADFIGKVPIQVGLQTDSGYPAQRRARLRSPEVNQSTGTLLVRGAFENDKRQLLPGYFVRVRVPLYGPSSRCWFRRSRWAATRRPLCARRQRRRHRRAAPGAARPDRRRDARGRKRPQARRARGRLRHPRRRPGPESGSAAADAESRGGRAGRIASNGAS